MDFNNIPAPMSADEKEKEISTNVFDVPEITAESIMDAFDDLDDAGHFKGEVFLTLERVRNVIPGKTYEEYDDTDKEFVDDISVQNCSINMYSLDGNLINVNFMFDNKDSAFLRDMLEMCNRYRATSEELLVNEISDTAIVLSVTIAPDKFAGKGACILNFPTMYTRVLADNGENAGFLMQFYQQDVRFIEVTMTEEEEREVVADALRHEAEVSAYYEEDDRR